MKTLRFTLAAAIIAALFTGCVGPEGQPGPQGPQGYSGVTGVADVGTSNPSDWSSSGGFLIAGYNVPDITSNAVSNGVIAVYFESTSNNWAPLPDVYPITTSVEQTLTYNYTPGILTLQLQNSNGSTPSAPAAFNFKVVIIPTALLKQHPGINIKDYNTVKQLMKLKD